MKKIMISLIVPFAFLSVLPAQITTWREADSIVWEYLSLKTLPDYISIMAKPCVQKGLTINTIFYNIDETIELDYACWVYYVDGFFPGGYYLIINASNGNLLEVYSENFFEPDDPSAYRYVTPNPILTETRWKLAGIVDANSSDIIELEPKGCEDCYTLTFIDEYDAIDQWVSSRVKLFTLADHKQQNQGFASFCGDRAYCEKYYYDGICYPDVSTYFCELYSTDSYTVTDDELKFFSGNDTSRYLLFKKIEKRTCPKLDCLIGTEWKMEGTVDVETGDLKVYEYPYPYGYDKCYILIFDSDWHFYGFSDVNDIFGYYQINYSTGEFYCNIGGTKVFYTGDSAKWTILFPQIRSFSLEDNQLKLYYNDHKNYLLFRPR